MSDYDVDFDDFAAFSPETQVKGPNLWLVQIAQNPTDQWTPTSGITAKIPLFFLKKRNNFLVQARGVGWWLAGSLQCLRQENDDQHWRTDLSETRRCTRSFSVENPWEQKMESSNSRIRWDHTSSKELRVFSSGVFIDSPSKKNKYWDGQVDRQVHSVPAASKRCPGDTLPVSAMSQEQR